MNNVYIAAPFPERAKASTFARVLRMNGFFITSRWITMEDAGRKDEPYLREWAQSDLEDLDRADIVFALNSEKWANSGTGGRHVELGYAIAKEKPILLYGDRTNLFHSHPDVHYLADPGDYIKALKGLV